MNCPECRSELGHKLSCSNQDRSGFTGASYNGRIQGHAAQAVHLGLDAAFFDVPMISHVTGRLWQGGTLEDALLDDEFVKVVSMYPWGKHKVHPSTEVKFITAYDSAGGMTQETIIQAATEAELGLVEGPTLIACQAGLNRSGLVAGVVLMRQGLTADQAIKRLRKRHQLVLCNRSFENILRHGWRNSGNWGTGPEWLDKSLLSL